LRQFGSKAMRIAALNRRKLTDKHSILLTRLLSVELLTQDHIFCLQRRSRFEAQSKNAENYMERFDR
jgi:hypothetical protein